jgi:Uri superfamily endonuclease
LQGWGYGIGRQVKIRYKYYKNSEATYALIIYVSEDLKIRVGRLGEASFKKGYGSSGCKCLIYLFFIKDEKRTEKILREIVFLFLFFFRLVILNF